MLRTARVLALFPVLAVGCMADPPLDVAQNVDLGRFQGKWYEIASLPRATQTDCYGTTAFYSASPDGSFQFVNQCNVAAPAGPLKTVSMTATVPDPSVPAKLALDVGGFQGAYWVLEVGDRYEFAVVGHPSRAFLWILSRTPTLDPAVVQGIVTRAQGNRFDTSKLQYTPQPPPDDRVASAAPVGPVPAPPPTSGGCSAPGRAGGRGAWWLGVVAVAVGAWRRRRARAAA
ncbi:MAG TPA: lipocalin family protein [Polyangiaceae bacterium]|nr:lipocalin family protein [Polyangiaceae bacterium]